MSRNRDFGSAASSLAAPSSTYNGYAHVVDTTQASGWNLSPYNNFNFLINGGADNWQRGTTWTADSKFLADRWFWMGTNAGSRSTDVPAGQGLTYSMGFAYNATGSYPRICYLMPAEDALFLAGKTVTVSFWAKNVSGTAVFYGELQSLNVSNVFDYNVAGVNSKTFASLGAMSTSWQYYTWTFAVDSTASRGFYLNFVRDPQSASSTLITGLKMELGSVATPFTRAGGSLAQEARECQRYYYQTPTYVTASYSAYNSGNMITTPFFFPTKMRIAPTVTVADSASVANKITIYPGGGSSATGITPAATTSITTDYWYYVAGGTSSGSQGSSGIISLYYYASAEVR